MGREAVGFAVGGKQSVLVRLEVAWGRDGFDNKKGKEADPNPLTDRPVLF